MKKLYLLALVISVFLYSCGSSRSSSNVNRPTSKSHKSDDRVTNKIIKNAKSFEGTRYKFGGTTKSGMDCSGLVYVAFESEDIALPRVSRDMAKKGTRISLSKTAKGDLIFFQTNKSNRNINHVGLVIEINGGNVKFIHATSSKGVIISSLDERYWKGAFVEVRRVI